LAEPRGRKRRPIKFNSTSELRKILYFLPEEDHHERHPVSCNAAAVCEDLNVLSQTFTQNYRDIPMRGFDAFSLDAPIYRKTRSGHFEIESRQHLLRAELRRLLILIDGRRPAAELSRCVRTTELPEAIAELQTLGLIEPVSKDSSFVSVAVGEAFGIRESMPPKQLETARRAAAEAASELLGLASRPYCAMLLACRDSLDFRTLVSAVQSKLRATLGEDAATIFVESVRDAARA
jgi:hypothetical protein